MKKLIRFVFALLFLAALIGLGWMVSVRLDARQQDEKPRAPRGPAPVEAADVVRGPIEQIRIFSATLEPSYQFTVAPKVAGRITRIFVDIADTVTKGQVVAELDNDEYTQALAQAQADLAVAQANLTEAISSRQIAQREMDRIKTLVDRGVASDSQLDTAAAQQLARDAAVAVATAQVARSKALIETAKIRLGYTRITADWDQGDDQRVVGERFVDTGNTVAANADLLSIIDIDPIHAVMFVAERDYAALAVGQPVSLTTDAYADRSFTGSVSRIAPVFVASSRQARVELTIDNADRLLKPGMFVRVRARLRHVDDAQIIPVVAIVRRGDQDVVFMLDQSDKVNMVPVRLGIRQDDQVQVVEPRLQGRVITLGQQLLDDGARVRVMDTHLATPSAPRNSSEELR